MKQPTHPRPAAPTCTSCKRPVKPTQVRRTWCPACYMRWKKAGQPDTGPPPSPGRRVSPPTRAAALEAIQKRTAKRVRRYQALAATGMPPKRIARIMGVHLDTVYKYGRRVKV